MKLVDLRSKQNAAQFVMMNARQQRKAIGEFFKQIDLETAQHVADWTVHWASDLLGDDAEFVTAFDLWFVTTVLYDIDVPNDIPECIAEGACPQPWRNLLNRHGLPWRRFTKRDLEEVGATSLL